MRIGKKVLYLGLCALLFMTSGCTKQVSEEGFIFDAGVYEYASEGHNGPVNVEVEFSDEKIISVEVLQHEETPEIANNAIEKITSEIVEKQSLNIDAVSGATITSDAILNAVQECVVLANGDLDSLLKENNIEKENVTLQADIVVVGSGISGMATAISALENGASVILVEQQSELGRSFVTSFGNMMIGQVEENKEFHIADSDDTLEAFLQRWEKQTQIGGSRSEQYPDYDRVSEIIIESSETINWLNNMGLDMQLSFSKEQRGADIVKPVTQDNKSGGLDIVEKMIAQLDLNNAQILTSTTATSLIQKDGEVTGIIASSNDVNYTINATNVVLATGGFGGSDQYISELIPEILPIGYQYSGPKSNRGDGISMAIEVDAQIYDDSFIIPAPGKLLPTKALTDINSEFTKLNGYSPIQQGVISNKMMVNKEGSRIINEALDGTSIISEMINNNQGPYYYLFDSSSSEIVEILETGIETGDVIKASSIEQLQIDSNMTNLVDTFNQYQSYTTKQKDDDFNKKAENLISYATEGDYYLVEFVPDFVATIGGLVTSDSYQVLNSESAPINGLYAVGEIAHRFLYDNAQFANISNSASITMGKLVGENLANK